MGIGVIVGMVTVTVGSAIGEKILASMQKVDESAMLSLATKSGMAITAITIFAKAVKALLSLG
jgi:hypothetical protein